MAQWHACKRASPDALLLFRLGDFYEAFYDDAKISAAELELTLTKRGSVPMCGVPAHAADGYIDRLVSKGFKVAIAEQTEDPKKVKGLVKREVVRVVTPGTVVDSTLLSERDNNYFGAIYQAGKIFGLSLIDFTTGAFHTIELEEKDLLNELYKWRPSELLISSRFKEKYAILIEKIRSEWRCLISCQEDWHFAFSTTYQALLKHFRVQSLDGFGLRGMTAGVSSSGALLTYLRDSLSLSVGHILAIVPENLSQFMVIDSYSQRHLELTESIKDGSRAGTLLSILDRTSTPMGGRLLRHWIKQPLLSPAFIKERQDAIESFYESPSSLSSHLQEVRDLERLSMKVISRLASPRDVKALELSLQPLHIIKEALKHRPSQRISILEPLIETFPELVHVLQSTLVDAPPFRLGEGVTFRKGVSKELDTLQEFTHDGKAWLIRYQNELKETLGIKTLKVGYNKMFGYYLEVSRGQADKVPGMFQRKQTLVNAERFVSPELKDFEYKSLHAEEEMRSIERALFQELIEKIGRHFEKIQKTAKAIAEIDCYLSLGLVARDRNYHRPTVNDSHILKIEEGRHPVIEAIQLGEPFIANNTWIDDDQERLIILTGPNMAGKSTYIRQVALIAIMAHIGSFVPANSADIGVIDKVFTRIGASDDLARGQSTFMVEMTETANILHNATSRSLVVLDEIGRGTSTFDGISIAWSIAEYLLTYPGKTAKTLFATHYFELTKLAEKVKGAVNYNVAVLESENDVIFLRQIIRGAADKSYGIHVAGLAGLPPVILKRAKEILAHLEQNSWQKDPFDPSKPKKIPPKFKSPTLQDLQLTLF